MKQIEAESEPEQGDTVTVKYKEGDFKGKIVKRVKNTDKFLIRWTACGAENPWDAETREP